MENSKVIFELSVSNYVHIEQLMSVHVLLYRGVFLFQAFCLPYLRFCSNRIEVSRSPHLHFPPSFQFPRLDFLSSNSYFCLKKQSDLLPYLEAHSLCSSSQPLIVHAQPSFFPVSFPSSLHTVEPLYYSLYGLMNINERSIRTCSCSTEYFSQCVCVYLHVNSNDRESKRIQCCMFISAPVPTRLMRSFKRHCFNVLIS